MFYEVNSLAVQRLGLRALTAEGLGSIPGRELRSHKPRSQNIYIYIFYDNNHLNSLSTHIHKYIKLEVFHIPYFKFPCKIGIKKKFASCLYQQIQCLNYEILRAPNAGFGGCRLGTCTAAVGWVLSLCPGLAGSLSRGFITSALIIHERVC